MWKSGAMGYFKLSSANFGVGEGEKGEQRGI